MDWKGKRALVTGGSGVIGRELLDRLVRLGAVVHSIDLVPLDAGRFPHVSAEVGDLADMSLDAALRFDPHVTLHLAAAFERSKESPEFRDRNWRHNALASHRVVDFASSCRSLEVFVFASSYLIYDPRLYFFSGAPQEPHRLREGEPPAPRNLCGAAKFYTERDLEALTEHRPSCRTVSARIYRVYGKGSKDVIGRWVGAALRGEVLEVYGRPNRFDYIFAGDVAEGLVRLAASEKATGVINLGSGVAHGVDDVLQALRELVPSVRTREMNNEEPVEGSVADLSRLRETTGWVPETALVDGIRTVLEAARP